MSENLWEDVKKSLQQRHAGNEYVETWFQPTQLVDVQEKENTGTCFNLGVPTELHKYWISEHFLKEIQESIQEFFPAPFSVKIDVKPTDSTGIKEHQGNKTVEKPVPQTFPQKEGPNRAEFESKFKSSTEAHNNYARPIASDLLNKDYTFSNFVVGRNNEFAHAACHNIAENPMGSDYNPLFICGPTGMGKTHLINAVANHILEKDPSKIITYVSAEKFLNDCVSCLRRAEMHKFRKKYRDRSDVLLMDDIQILGKGEVIQQEFFHTLNEYLESGRQVVVASDRMPKDIKDFEDRIRTLSLIHI